MSFNVVVTGSSSGIGRQIALEFAKAGAEVLTHGFRNKSGLAEVAAEVAILSKQASGKSLLADLSEEASAAKFFEAALQQLGNIDVWVNAAGADVLTGTAAKLNFMAKLDLLWSIDVRATIQLSRLAAASMQQHSASTRKLCILNISWDQAERGMAGESGQYFCAVKAAVAAFSKSLAMTVGPAVRVNCLAPGWIQTSWGETASEAWQTRAIGESSLARWGTPGDIAAAAVWLASPAAEFINGQTININGGWQPASS